MQEKTQKRIRLKKRVRSRLSGTSARPRLSVFKSNKFIYAQVIDDTKGATLAQANDSKAKKGSKMERAQVVGKTLAEACKKLKISEVVFDRNGFKYAGRIKSVADAAREGGLKF